MSSISKSIWIVALGLAGGLVTGFSTHRGDRPPPGAEGALPTASTVETSPRDARYTTPRELVRRYFPERAERIIAAMSGPENGLDERLDLKGVPTWDEMRVRIRESDIVTPAESDRHVRVALQWPDGRGTEEVDLARLVEGSSEARPSPSALVSAREIARSYDGRLCELGALAFEAYSNRLLEQWRRDELPHIPLVHVPAAAPRGRPLIAGSVIVMGGWYVSTAICEGDDPVYDALLADIRQLKREREAAVRARLRDA